MPSRIIQISLHDIKTTVFYLIVVPGIITRVEILYLAFYGNYTLLFVSFRYPGRRTAIISWAVYHPSNMVK